jgi:hypothetical protein
MRPSRAAHADRANPTRLPWQIAPVKPSGGACFQVIDTLAAEYPAVTNYLYMSYLAVENDVGPSEKAPPRRITIVSTP